MAGRKRPLEEKVQALLSALEQLNVEAAARKAGVAPSTLRDDLKKVGLSLTTFFNR